MTELAQEKNNKKFILGIAFLQGLALLLIWLWVDTLDNARQYFDVILPLYVLAISLPLSLMLLAGHPRKLAFKLTAAFSLIAALCAMYFGDIGYVEGLPRYGTEGLVFQFGFCMVIAWFIAVTFIEHYCQYRHWFNRYESLYDFSWRNAVKLITSAIFTGLFWVALLLLANLFKVLGITFFKTLIENIYFIYPATAVAFGLGISLYNAKQEVLSEFKRAILQVLGWLLPMVSLILLAFVFTLPFKGLTLLWGTGYATSLMLSLLMLMVFLLNTAFQDGKQTQYPAWLLKLSNFAVLSMPIYATLCIYALYLRINQYGWTDDRVWAASITFVMAIYSMGYAYAALQSFKQNSWMQSIKPVNVMAAICLICFIGLLYSPIFSPMRIGVQSQLARLNHGKIAADKFDYEYLRFNGGKYGDAALRAFLADTAHPQASNIKPLAAAALKKEYRTRHASKDNREEKNRIADAKALQALTTVYPKDTLVDSSFFEMLFLDYQSNKVFFDCLRHDQVESAHHKQHCHIVEVDLDKDQQAELIVLSNYGGRVYSKTTEGWDFAANIHLECCNNQTNKSAEVLARELEVALVEGKIQVVEPKWKDLKLGDKTYKISQ